MFIDCLFFCAIDADDRLTLIFITPPSCRLVYRHYISWSPLSELNTLFAAFLPFSHYSPADFEAAAAFEMPPILRRFTFCLRHCWLIGLRR